MIEKINRIKRKLDKSTNPNEVYIYKAVLDSYEHKLRNLLASDLTEDEIKDILEAINNKQRELRSKIDLLSRSDYNLEEIDRLRDFLRILDDYKTILRTNLRMPQKDENNDIKENFSIELAIALSKVKNVVLKRSNFSSSVNYDYEPDYDTIGKLIDIDSNEELVQELIQYTETSDELEDFKKYARRRIHAREEFDKLLPVNNILSIYNLLIERYFSAKTNYDKLLIERNEKLSRLEELKKNTNPLSNLFKKNTINKLSEEINVLNQRLNHVKEDLSHARRQVDICVDGLKESRLKTLFKFNREILFTLGYIPTKENPFCDSKLDVTFQDILDSATPTDVEYFIGSNLHNINEENLSEIMAYFDEVVARLQSRIEIYEKAKKESYYELSDEAKELLEKEPELVRTLVTLNTTTNKYGIKSMSYIYALDGLSASDDITTTEAINMIYREDESITWSTNPLTKSATVLAKK